MQSGSNRPVAGARRVGINRRCGRLCVLLLGLMVSACSNIGQIGDFNRSHLLGTSNEAPRVSVAVELVDGPPPAVHERFMRALKDEAGSRQIAVVASGDASYRLRGYLATHPEGGATAISWAWDVYDPGQRRAFRLKGEDKATGAAGWATADDQVLRRIAGSALDQLAGLHGVAPPGSGRSGRRAGAAAGSGRTQFDLRLARRLGAREPPESSAFSAVTRPRPKSRRCPNSRSPAPCRCRAAGLRPRPCAPSRALAYASRRQLTVRAGAPV